MVGERTIKRNFCKLSDNCGKYLEREKVTWSFRKKEDEGY